ncbi:MAG: TonB family protein [Verrucomicrobiota bacterium]
MTSTVPFATQPIGLSVSKAASAIPATTVRLGLQQAKDHCFLCWMVAVTTCFLTVGVIGVFEGDGYIPLMLSGTKGDPGEGLESLQAAMVEVQSQEVSPEMVEETVEGIDVPPPLEVIEVAQEIPEIVPALVTEDVFTIPTPPRVETALRPVEPKPEQPKPKAKTVAKPNVRRGPTASPARGPQGSSMTASGGGGSGGTGNVGNNLSRGQFNLPPPSYPSHLKSEGVTGTVRLLIIMNASGRAESVSIISSSGSSDLDEFTASYARRNSRSKGGVAGKISIPITYRFN